MAEKRGLMNKYNGKKMLALVCATGLMLGMNSSVPDEIAAAKKPVFLAKTSASVSLGKSLTVKVKKATKVKIKKKTFSSSNKSVAAVSKSGKVTAKKTGTATIKVKVKYVKKPVKKVKTCTLKCKVTVTGQKTPFFYLKFILKTKPICYIIWKIYEIP